MYGGICLMMKKFKLSFLILVSVCVGIVIGGYLFSQSQPRSFLAIQNCERCLSPSDLAGLLGSVVLQKFPGLIPFVVHETTKAWPLSSPFPGKKLITLLCQKGHQGRGGYF